ncbi:unnamed protein product [Paramecium octaurelia]|uniref:CG-1 domain-containing protein n=1 Tax=Paramecium octaurelia TaxID=43137 RepID=A0A8S1SSL2_PAROT|nr:unnamed protein product [Paramecium octaurelia]
MLNISLRWLKTQEVYQILTELKLEIHLALPNQPPSGQYFLIRPEKERGWKKDGYQYIPRHNGVGTREDVEKLKINGIPMIICLYSQTVKKDGQQLNRRIYKLLEQSQNIYLVHYLNSQFSEVGEQNEVFKQSEPLINLQINNEFQCDSWFLCDFQDQQQDLELKQKISILEKRIQYLEQERNTGASSSTHRESSDEFNSSFKEALSVKIVDYSPEWDYTEGGMKMMLCFQPLKEIYQCQILFGNIPVVANCVQPGVLKCIVPPNVQGKVELKIISNGIFIDEQNETNYFTYKQKRKTKKDKQQKEKLIEQDKIDSSEFKVRVIEKLASFQAYFNNTMNMQVSNMEQEQIESIEQIDDYKVTQLISQIIVLGRNHLEAVRQFLDEQDSYGFSLIHYLTLLGYSQAIKLILKNGANINQSGCDGLTALQIAIILQQEEIVNLLIQLGAIDDQFNECAEKKPDIDQLFSIDSVYQNKKILDLLIRGYTLCDSIHNSSSYTEQQSWNGQDDQDTLQYFEVNDLFENKNSPVIKNEEKHTKHKYLRNYSKHEVRPQQMEFNSNFPYDNYANHIQTIQKNVKAWLLRRQYLDIKYATQVLQNYIRNKLHKKQMNPDCKSKIKSTVRNWLNLKY